MTDRTPDPPAFEPFRVERSERIYDSPWCGLRRDVIELSGGKLQEYHVVEISPAVAVVPVLPDGRIALLWQLRHPHGGTHWEIPAGRIHDGEDPKDAATRELLEETGLRSDDVRRVAGFYPTNGISPHYAHIFVARDCERVRDPEPDAAERLSVHWMPESEVRARLEGAEFEDGFTALALFYLFAGR